jgi:hypothetical protein
MTDERCCAISHWADSAVEWSVFTWSLEHDVKVRNDEKVSSWSGRQHGPDCLERTRV